MAEATIADIQHDEAVAIFGNRDEHLRLLRDELALKVVARSGSVTFQGTPEKVDQGVRVFDRMRARVRSKQALGPEEVRHFLAEVRQAGSGSATDGPAEVSSSNASTSLTTSVPANVTWTATAEISGPLRKLRVRSAGQANYVNAIRGHDLTFGIGPAGTGKTYLAVACALEAFDKHQVKRIVLVRPAVEAGEKLGYLPGDMQAKVHPFLRPLLDALRDMVDFHQVRSYMENDIVEIAPLAYMRGRTLNDSFVILDEAQNTTVPQMRMFLTRMGMGSKVVVTGDVTQVDLPAGVANGLDDAVARLESLERLAVVRMRASDIVRHPLVQEIVNAYGET